MQISRFIIVTTLALAACNKAPEKGTNSSNTAMHTGEHVETSPVASVANSFSPEQSANGANAMPAADKAIPAAFQGRWALVPKDCGPDASIAKGLMTVDGKQLRFYESVGKPAVVTNPTPNRMEGRFSFTGEGMEWSKDIVLTLEGETLARTESNPKASYVYTRCPA